MYVISYIRAVTTIDFLKKKKRKKEREREREKKKEQKKISISALLKGIFGICDAFPDLFLCSM